MPTLQEIAQKLENLAPTQYQESYDNSGLLVGEPSKKIHKIITCLDATEAVVAEAKREGADLIVAHHPIVFKGLKRFNGTDYVERTVMQAIREDIAIYAIHTNLDNVAQGVNARIAQQLKLENPQILAPKLDDPERGQVGAGMYGKLPQPMKAQEFLAYVANCMAIENIRYTDFSGEIETVALCGGAGSFLLPDALKVGAQAFITGDFKYHQFFDAEERLMIADIGHYESEKFTINLLQEFLQAQFPTLSVATTAENTNPVRYFSAM